MKLGILVNSDKNLEAVVGLTQAALAKGHEVALFAMDSGTRLLENTSYSGLCSRPNVTMSFCEHSAQKVGAKTAGLDPKIVAGSQYDNATMMHNADKVIVL